MASFAEVTRAIFEQINIARTQPNVYAEHLHKTLQFFRGSDFCIPGKVTLMTNEGPAAVNEAIQALQSMRPVGAMQWSEDLGHAAQDHVNDVGPKGLTGHTGSDGSSMSDRIERYAEWSGQVGENCGYDFENPVESVCQFLVDDGVSSRGHRNNLLGSQFKFVGVCAGPHSDMTNTVTIVFAGSVTSKGSGNKPSVSSAPAFRP
jgi:uncharacterized protein YkwD